jgi:UDP-N-acetylglucosamine:LPS N-acetylglucosamine transferase
VFNTDTLKNTEHIIFENYLLSSALEKAIQQSKLVICRSGYSTVMDLAKLGAKALFIPTPGQFEQEYLAKRLDSLKIAPFALQQAFTLDLLNDTKGYLGFKKETAVLNLNLFQLFEGKSKF